MLARQMLAAIRNSLARRGAAWPPVSLQLAGAVQPFPAAQDSEADAADALPDTSILFAVPKKKVSHSRKRLRFQNKWLRNRQDFEYCSECGKVRQLSQYCTDGGCYRRIAKQLGFIPKDTPPATAAE